MVPSSRGTPQQVGFDPLKEHIILQQPVKLGQDGVHRHAERRD